MAVYNAFEPILLSKEAVSSIPALATITSYPPPYPRTATQENTARPGPVIPRAAAQALGHARVMDSTGPLS